jgi:hypothetical protein
MPYGSISISIVSFSVVSEIAIVPESECSPLADLDRSPGNPCVKIILDRQCAIGRL